MYSAYTNGRLYDSCQGRKCAVIISSVCVNRGIVRIFLKKAEDVFVFAEKNKRQSGFPSAFFAS